MIRTQTSSRADLGYIRNRDAGKCKVGRFSTAHVAVLDPIGQLHVEVLTSYELPRWYGISAKMRPNEIAKALRKCATISPQFKAVYLAMLDAGANGEEVRRG